MKVIVQNLAIEYQDEGSGPVMLFLHGWQDSLHTFDSLVPLLRGHRIIRLDLPGFGASEIPKQVWNLDDYVRLVKDFIQKINIEPYIFVGHSFGGRIIIKGQATNNLRTKKIVLISSAGVAKRNTVRNTVLKIFAKIAKFIMYIPPLIFWRKSLRRRLYTLIGSDYLNAGALKQTFLKVIEEDLSSSAQTITTPTLLIWGSNDAQTPVMEGRKLKEFMKGSRLEILEGAGHFVHRERPQEVAQLIQTFL